jgi:hypothetical protein
VTSEVDVADFESAASYVDVSVLTGALAGGLVLLAALWAFYLLNWLWQGSLRDEHRGAIDLAVGDLGLRLEVPGLRARVVAEGVYDGRPLRVEWRGGLQGAHSRVRWGAQRWDGAPLADAAALRAVLSQLAPAP